MYFLSLLKLKNLVQQGLSRLSFISSLSKMLLTRTDLPIIAWDDLKPPWRGTLRTTANVHSLLPLSTFWHPKRDKILSLQVETRCVQLPQWRTLTNACQVQVLFPVHLPPKESILEVTNVGFKVRLDRLWATWSSWCPQSLEQGWTRLHLRVPFNPKHSIVLWLCKSSQKALCFITCCGVGDGIFL